jgi:hypothetical protein
MKSQVRSTAYQYLVRQAVVVYWPLALIMLTPQYRMGASSLDKVDSLPLARGVYLVVQMPIRSTYPQIRA